MEVADMKARWGEVAGALLTFLVFVVLPLAIINYLPAQIMEQLSATGFNVQSLATQTAMLGLVISAIALAKAIADRTSVAYLVLDISSNIVSLAFALLVVGVGNIGSLGYSSFSLKQGKVVTEIVLDLRVFIYLTIGVVTVSVLQSVAKFREARAESVKDQQPN
jgi:hypothetical protein